MEEIKEICIPYPLGIYSSVNDENIYPPGSVFEINGKRCITYHKFDLSMASNITEVNTKNAAQVVFGAGGIENSINVIVNVSVKPKIVEGNHSLPIGEFLRSIEGEE